MLDRLELQVLEEWAELGYPRGMADSLAVLYQSALLDRNCELASEILAAQGRRLAFHQGLSLYGAV
ncbi:MAG TPA: hypothetical protein VF434_01220 [Promineifilum sp.]